MSPIPRLTLAVSQYIQLILVCLCVLLLSPLAAQAQGAPQRVLILHSYHQGYSWTDDVQAAVSATFAQSELPLDVHVKYLDAARMADPKAFRRNVGLLHQQLVNQFAGKPFDLVLVSDNAALEFLLEHREPLTDNAPVVFCGINNYTPEMLRGQSGIAGVAEMPSFDEAIELALKLRPKASKLLVLAEETPTGKANKALLLAQSSRFSSRVEIEVVNETDIHKLEARLADLGPEWVVLPMVRPMDEHGVLSTAEASQRLSRASAVPLIAAWDFWMGHGPALGVVVSAKHQGEAAAAMAIWVLKGERAESIPVVTQGNNVVMADTLALTRFGMAERLLPEGAVILNAPASFYAVNKGLFWTGGVIGLCLLLLSLSLARNVSRRKRTEESLRESEARFKALHNASFGGITIHEKGRILECNQGLSDISGYAYEELIGMDGLLLIAEQSRDLVMANIFAGYEKPYEAYGLRKNGEVYPLRLEARNIPYQGRYVRTVEFRDITESRLAQQAMEQEAQRRRILMEKSLDGIVIIDQEHRVVEANERFAYMLGYSREEVVGLYTWDYEAVLSEADIRATLADFCSVSRVLETSHRRKDGSLLNVEVSLSGAAVAEQPLIFAICRDITERQKAEEEIRQEEVRLRKLVEILQCDTTDTKALLDIALSKCLELTGSRYGYIYHYDEDSQQFTLNTWSRDVMEACSVANPDTCYALSKTGIWGEAVRQRRAIIVNDFKADNPLKRGYPEGHASLTGFMTVPIISSNRIVAVVGVANKQGDYTEREVLQLTLLMEATWRVLERRRAEETLRASEERLALALDAAEEGLWDWDASSGPAYFSPRYYTMLGYQPGDFLGTFDVWESLVHPDDIERTLREITEKLETSEPFETVFRMRTKSGDWAWILSRGKVMEKDAEGRAKRMVGTHVDITERKRAEEDLLESETRFQLAMAASQDGLFDWNLVTNEIYYSPGWKSMLGYEYDELPNDFSVWGRTTDSEDVKRSWTMQQELINNQRDRFELEFKMKHKDGHWVDILSRATAIFDDSGTAVRMVGTHVDITERKKAEDALLQASDAANAANRAKSEFLANMSHEIRTPLNGVLGMLQLIRDCKAPGDVDSYAEMALRAGQRLTNLLNDILDLSRIEAGRMPIESKPFALADIFTALAETFSPLHYSKNLSLVINASPDIQADVVGDEIRVRQILFNLVGNAMKFTDKGEVRLEVSTLLPLPSGHTRLLFVVSDTGLGIPDEKLGLVCAPFVQVSSDFTRSHQGAGLGLSIARKLIDAMSGTLTFESTEGQGTSVYLMLPFGTPEGSAIPATPESVHDAEARTSLRLLLVEDEEISRLSARLNLEKLGHQVVTANNGEEALEALRVSRYDCVLMDVQMDVLDGVAATRAIRSGASGVLDAQIPIVAMTAYAMAGDRENFLEAGMSDYVAKPVQVGELQKALGRVIGKNR